MAQRRVVVCLCLSLGWAACSGRLDQGGGSGQQSSREQVSAPILLPTGAYITPDAAVGSTFQTLNPGLPSRPDFIAGQAVNAALGPDGRTLLVLTSGYNRNRGPDGHDIPEESNEYVFLFDTSVTPPAQRQVIQVQNTFDGLAWTPTGDAFLVSGGTDDSVHIYSRQTDGSWAESLPAIDLGLKSLYPLPSGAAGCRNCDQCERNHCSGGELRERFSQYLGFDFARRRRRSGRPSPRKDRSFKERRCRR